MKEGEGGREREGGVLYIEEGGVEIVRKLLWIVWIHVSHNQRSEGV